jgi:hypothetical protein
MTNTVSLEDLTIVQLKEMADAKEITYSPNIGKNKLIARIEAKYEEEVKSLVAANVISPDNTDVQDLDEYNIGDLKVLQLSKEELAIKYPSPMQLVRCIVDSADPHLKIGNAVAINIGNKFGRVVRHVPFNEDTHIEKMVYDYLKAQKTTQPIPITKGSSSKHFVRYEKGNRFSITLLDSLTPEQVAAILKKNKDYLNTKRATDE